MPEATVTEIAEPADHPVVVSKEWRAVLEQERSNLIAELAELRLWSVYESEVVEGPVTGTHKAKTLLQARTEAQGPRRDPRTGQRLPKFIPPSGSALVRQVAQAEQRLAVVDRLLAECPPAEDRPADPRAFQALIGFLEQQMEDHDRRIEEIESKVASDEVQAA